MTIRAYYSRRGGHIHVRVFTGTAKSSMTFAKSGDLVFSLAEWPTIKDMLRSAVDFLPEDPTPERG